MPIFVWIKFYVFIIFASFILRERLRFCQLIRWHASLYFSFVAYNIFLHILERDIIYITMITSVRFLDATFQKYIIYVKVYYVRKIIYLIYGICST